MATTNAGNLFPPKLALSRQEAADALGISPVTIDRLTKRGLLKPSRATRRPLYPIWEIERFLRETGKPPFVDPSAMRVLVQGFRVSALVCAGRGVAPTGARQRAANIGT